MRKDIDITLPFNCSKSVMHSLSVGFKIMATPWYSRSIAGCAFWRLRPLPSPLALPFTAFLMFSVFFLCSSVILVEYRKVKPLMISEL